MAQIIKHRRGLIGGVKNLTARNGELIIASGSISDLAGPFVFIGSPNTVDEGVAGAFNSVSKLYTGTAAPTITAATYGSALDGTPYYASGNKSLYILNNSNVGNTQMDLTGNIEGNTISGVTINKLQSTNVTSSFFTGSFIGDGTGLYNVPASGVTGLELNQIGQGTVTASITEAGGLRVNTNTEVTGTLIVTSDTHIGGDVYVTGSEYVDDIISRTGNATNALHLNGGVLGAPDVELTSVNNISLFAEGGTPVVNVTGSMKVTGDVTVEQDMHVSGNIYQTGSFYTQGDIVLSGSINIGDNISTDVINFNGEVSSSIIPKIHNAFDLGSPENNWRNIHVSGTAYIDILQAQQVNFNDLGILTDLSVSGSTYLGNGNDILVVSGSIYNDELTEKRLVVVGAQGLLTDYTGLTFDNGNLNVSGAIEVTDIQGTGSLYLKPDKNDSRIFEIYNTGGNDIHIKGNATYNFFGDDTNYLNIDSAGETVTIDSTNGLFIGTTLQAQDTSELQGAVGMNSSLDVTGSVVLKDTLQVKGATGLNSTLDVTGSATLKSTLEVKGATGLNSTLDVTGSATLKSTLEVKGATGLNSSLDVTGSAVLKDTLQVKGATGLNSSLDVTGSAVLKDTLQVKAATGLNSTLDVTGSATLKSTLEVKGATGLNSSLDVTGSAVLKSTLEVGSTSELKGAVGINSTLDVTGSAQFKSTINVDSVATVSSSVVEDLTQYRVVGVGSGGALIDYSGLTYNGTTLKIGGGQFEVDNGDGDIRTSGSLTVNGGQTINGDMTVNGVLTVTGNTQLQANLYVSGNLEVLGSTTNVSIQSQTVDIGDNIIQVNAYSPFDRYAGLAAYDSGSSGTSGSILWDSTNDYWLLVNSNSNTSKVIGTTASTGGTGTEISLTSGTFPIATAANTIGDSLLTFTGTTLAFNTNKFTVDSDTGATAISGNLTLSYSGGTDNGTKTSRVTFRNSSNVLGFVSTTETTNELDGILGYNHSSGVLEFSTLIDGGTY